MSLHSKDVIPEGSGVAEVFLDLNGLLKRMEGRRGALLGGGGGSGDEEEEEG